MDIIPIKDDVSIEFGIDTWRLVKNENQGITLTPLAEFNGIGLKLNPAFASSQTLARVEIPAKDIARIFLGWEPQTHNWHLGLLLYSRPTDTDSGELMWCELAAWSSATSTQSISTIKRAGEELSRLLNRPFQMIEPDIDSPLPRHFDKDATAPSRATEAAQAVSIEIKPLPISTGDWSLHASPEGMIFRPAWQWIWNRVMRAGFFFLILIIYLVLGIGSRSSGLADVKPEWLPLVAFGMALVLGYSVGKNLWDILLRRQVVIDKDYQEVRSERALTHLVDWHVPFNQIEYLLISQEPAHSQGRRKRQDPMQISQETWVHVYADQQFFLLGNIGRVEGQSWDWETVRHHNRVGERRVVNLAEYDTPIHHAIRQIAKTLNVEAYLDIR